MSGDPKILIVDDEPHMCDSLESLLGGRNFKIFKSNSGQQTVDLLSKERFDIVLLDIKLPDISGIDLMDQITSKSPETSIILITGFADFDSAVSALRKGAYDYLRKPFEIEELKRTIENALNQKTLKQENEFINNELSLAEDRYQYLVHNSPDIIYILNDESCFIFINDAVERLIGFKAKDLIGKPYTDIIYEQDLGKAKWIFNERRTGDRASSSVEIRLKICGNEDRFRHSNVEYLPVELKSTGIYDKPVTEKDKRFLETHGVARDVSDRKEIEAKLHHDQRMKAVGTLAGGVAHDFNNLLMGIQGRASLMLLDTDSSHHHFKHLKEIEECIKSATDLTKQLLGFAREGKYAVKPSDLNELVRKSAEMFGRTRRELIVHTTFQEDIRTVEVDCGQIEQALLNLYINAWQAMPSGGHLYLETKNAILDRPYKKPIFFEPDGYVKISVTDTGIGIDKATQERIFEPFFTTKKRSRSTGLGLASVYGIVKNHGGIIDVSSKKGYGTTFSIYLPASDKKPIIEKKSTKEILKGSETVLLIDDEQMIIEVGKDILGALDYVVLIAMSGNEAIEIYQKNRDKIDIVILDMIMPEMGGCMVYDRLKEIDPKIKVLLSSGYSIEGKATKILDRGCSGFIQKPFDMIELSHMIREILDR